MKSFLTTITILYTTLLSAAVYQENITSGGSGNWSDPNSWLPVGVPTSSDTAIISDATIIIDVDTTIKCLILENTGRIHTNKKLTIMENFYFKGGNTYGDSSIVAMDTVYFMTTSQKIVRNRIILESFGLWEAGALNFIADPDDGGEVVADPDDGGEIFINSNFLAKLVTGGLTYTNGNSTVFNVGDNAVFKATGGNMLTGTGTTLGLSTNTSTAKICLDCEVGDDSGGTGGIQGGDGNTSPGGSGTTGIGCNANEAGSTSQKTTIQYGKILIGKNRAVIISGGMENKPGSEIAGDGNINFKKALIKIMGSTSIVDIDSLHISDGSIVEGDATITSKRVNIANSTLRDSMTLSVDSLIVANSYLSGKAVATVSDYFCLEGTANTINRKVKVMAAGDWLSDKVSFAYKGKIEIENGSNFKVRLDAQDKQYSRGRGKVIHVKFGGELQFTNDNAGARMLAINARFDNISEGGGGGISVDDGGNVKMINSNTEIESEGGSGSGNTTGGSNPPTNQTCDVDPMPIDSVSIDGCVATTSNSKILFKGGKAYLGSSFVYTGPGVMETDNTAELNIKNSPNPMTPPIMVKGTSTLNIYKKMLTDSLVLSGGTVNMNSTDTSFATLIRIHNGSGILGGTGHFRTTDLVLSGGKITSSGEIVTNYLNFEKSPVVEKTIRVKVAGRGKLEGIQMNINFASTPTSPIGKIIIDTNAIFIADFDQFDKSVTSFGGGGNVFEVNGTFNKIGSKRLIFGNNLGIKINPSGTLNILGGSVETGSAGLLVNEGTLNIANNCYYNVLNGNVDFAGTAHIKGQGRLVSNGGTTHLRILDGSGIVSIDSIVVGSSSGSKLTIERPLSGINYQVFNGEMNMNNTQTNANIHLKGFNSKLQGSGTIYASNLLWEGNTTITGSGDMYSYNTNINHPGTTPSTGTSPTLGKKLILKGIGPHNCTISSFPKTTGAATIQIDSTTLNINGVKVFGDVCAIQPHLEASAQSTINYSHSSPLGSFQHQGKFSTQGTVNIEGNKTLSLRNITTTSDPNTFNVIKNATINDVGGNGLFEMDQFTNKFLGTVTLNTPVKVKTNVSVIDSTAGLAFSKLTSEGAIFKGSGSPTVSSWAVFKNQPTTISEGNNATFTILPSAVDTLSANITLNHGRKLILKGNSLWKSGSIAKTTPGDSLFIDNSASLKVTTPVGLTTNLNCNTRIAGQLTVDGGANHTLSIGAGNGLHLSNGTFYQKQGKTLFNPSQNNFGIGTIIIDTAAIFEVIGNRNTMPAGLNISGNGYFDIRSNGNVIFEDGSTFTARMRDYGYSSNAGVINESFLNPKSLEVKANGAQYGSFINRNKVLVDGNLIIGAYGIVTGTDTITVMDSTFVIGANTTGFTTIGSPLKCLGGLKWTKDQVNGSTNYSYTKNGVAVSLPVTNPSILIYNKAFISNANNNQSFQPNIYVYNSAIKKINGSTNIMSGFINSYGIFNLFANGGELHLNKIGNHLWANESFLRYEGGLVKLFNGVKISVATQ